MATVIDLTARLNKAGETPQPAPVPLAVLPAEGRVPDALVDVVSAVLGEVSVLGTEAPPTRWRQHLFLIPGGTA